MEVKKFEYIDSLRGIAILLVILVHTKMLGEPVLNSEFLKNFIENGKLGVQLFFVASAFTLMLSFKSRINEKHRDRNFFIRRFFRIAPLYYAMAIFMLFDILCGWNIIYVPQIEGGLLPKVITHVFFVNALSPTYILSYIPGGWSISVELLFYLSVPFICARIKSLDSSLRLVVFSLICSVCINKMLAMLTNNQDFLSYNPVAQFPVFTIGFLAYYILYGENREIKPLTIALVVASIFVFCYVYLPYHILYSFVFGGLLLLLSIKPYKILSNKLFASIGKVSFSMYITHFIVVFGLKKIDLNSLVGFDGSLIFFLAYYLLIVILTYLLSSVTYTSIEKPFQNIGRRLIKKIG